jgi:4-amino-4-deoxy-L-arabinose transferase-like glycosyltransferase
MQVTRVLEAPVRPCVQPLRARPRIPRPPTPLVALLFAVAIVTFAWALFVPPGQVPDETGHYVYTQSLAENLKRPPDLPDGVPPFLSPEAGLAVAFAHINQIVGRPELKPPWNASAESQFDGARRLLPADRGKHIGSGAQATDPPLYHAYETIPYAVAGGTYFDRLYAMRLWSALLILVTTTGAWLLAGELLGRDRTLQLVAASCVGLQPMVTFMSGGVNPDSGAFALASLVLWLSVRVLRRGPSRWSVAGLLAALFAAGLVKTAMLALVPAVAVALLVSFHRARRTTGTGVRRTLMWSAGLCGLAVAGGLIASRHALQNFPSNGGIRDFAGYVWQYYLPRLPFETEIPQLAGSGVYDTWLRGSWGSFGWLDVRFPDAAYWVFGALSVAAFAGAVAALARRRVRTDRAVLAFFAIALVSLPLALHLAEYESLLKLEGAINQGRYLLPLLPIAGVATAGALTNLRPARRVAAAGLVIGAMVVLQLFALGLVAGRFYV